MLMFSINKAMSGKVCGQLSTLAIGLFVCILVYAAPEFNSNGSKFTPLQTVSQSRGSSVIVRAPLVAAQAADSEAVTASTFVELQAPNGIATDANDNVFIFSCSLGCLSYALLKFSPSGVLLGSIPIGGLTTLVAFAAAYDPKTSPDTPKFVLNGVDLYSQGMRQTQLEIFMSPPKIGAGAGVAMAQSVSPADSPNEFAGGSSPAKGQSQSAEMSQKQKPGLTRIFPSEILSRLTGLKQISLD
ncbi:hypothetical protein [Gloeobacter morelensis]|uniref:Uncharacterized protein n=1 Tax=Gloeobacter morelensis MG652769 TaxID=2781736 RepID=A0ABY3PL88_9CYAN|nr:hypothetical protein [Gloeobacter morelensis]UFP94349.1 hypothetical protein ISF26_21815 [Gloeobacter morelensis MG652769]